MRIFLTILMVIAEFSLESTPALSKWILELGDHFADIRKEGYWLVNFYTPWCGHCKRLEPIWAHVVQALKNTHVRVGRVDCSSFPKVAKIFGIVRYPTIQLIKAEGEYTFTGDMNSEEIINFAIRMAGPPVQLINHPESLTNIKNRNQLYFMYVGEREGLLWTTFNDVASRMQAHAFYYATSADIAQQHVDLHTLPAVLVHKENTHYFYSVEEGNDKNNVEQLNASIHQWVFEEHFESFPKITEGNFDQILRTKKYIAIVVVEENKLKQVPKEMVDFRNMFGWTSLPELANHIVMEILTLPYFLVLNSTTLHHYIPDDDPMQMTTDAIDVFLEGVCNRSAFAYGGNDLFVQIYRTYFKAKTTLADRWLGNPVLTMVLLGLPLGFLTFILYSCCCADILDADDEEELHEKRE